MHETQHLLWGLTLIFALGIAAQWVAWRLRLPSILLLLIAGYVCGPMLGLFDPDALLGDLLLPLVSLSVALILFEGGLTLRMRELRESGGAIPNLVIVGGFITWVLAAMGAYWILEFPLRVALVCGAILVVTGPTVVGPLLRHINPTGRVGSIAKWEGIVIDPVGAILAVLVFEAVLAMDTGGPWRALGSSAMGLVRTILVGGVIGVALSVIMIQVIRRRRIPDFLHIPMMLAMVFVGFTVSNRFQEESGLMTVTLMGILLANQRSIRIRHIIEFKETLRLLLISVIFVVLAARLPADLHVLFNWRNLAFLALLIFIVRPLAVFASTMGSTLNWREKVFLSWLAPRGIVAAAVASLFAFFFGEAGEQLVPVTFLVIIVTVAVYGLTLPWVARWLGLATPNPQGLLIAGANPLGRAIATALKETEIKILVVDNNWGYIRRARMEGLPTQFSSILSEYITDELNLGGIGRVIAVTPNDEVNSLAALHFSEIFGRDDVYQLPPEATPASRAEAVPQELSGRYLFHPEAHYHYLSRRLMTGAIIKATQIGKEFTFDDYLREYPQDPVPMFVISERGELRIIGAEDEPRPKAGDTVIGLVQPAERRREERREQTQTESNGLERVTEKQAEIEEAAEKEAEEEAEKGAQS